MKHHTCGIANTTPDTLANSCRRRRSPHRRRPNPKASAPESKTDHRATHTHTSCRISIAHPSSLLLTCVLHNAAAQSKAVARSMTRHGLDIYGIGISFWRKRLNAGGHEIRGGVYGAVLRERSWNMYHSAAKSTSFLVGWLHMLLCARPLCWHRGDLMSAGQFEMKFNCSSHLSPCRTCA